MSSMRGLDSLGARGQSNMFSGTLKLNLLLTTLSVVVAVLLAEVLLRCYMPHSALGAGSELQWMRENPGDLRRVFTIDPAFGFRPLLGNNLYSEFGAKINTYDIEKAAGKERLLFIGDSVTRRGKLIAALRRLYGEERFEYWNAGVESFNTIQEVEFYKRYNIAIDPDHVILTFCLNDFETTPIAFRHEDRLVVYAPNTRLDKVNPWLFRHSYVYRLVLALAMTVGADGREGITREVRDSLTEMKSLLSADDTEFTILILPYFKPHETWTPDEKERRLSIIGIVEDLQIRHFDLLGVLNDAVRDGIEVQEIKGDFWHPSDEISTLFAGHLHEKGIFQP